MLGGFMMADGATRRGAEETMVTGDMAGDTADNRAFDATLCGRGSSRRGNRKRRH
jgi:hypothetical protein